MKISGFTIIKNAVVYDFPIIEAVRSALDICDEFIIVAGDSDDATDELLAKLDSPKVRIIKTVWRTENKRQLYGYQTDIGLKACTGDWCLYVQSDEVIHHDSLPKIKEACEKYLYDPKIEGFLFRYVHIWGDYNHYIDALHFAYPREIRIVRNLPEIHSWRDAQSFRVVESGEYTDYYQSEGTRKLNCILLDAWMFHYGWSRDPRCIVGKINAQNAIYLSDRKPIEGVDYFDYGNLNRMPLFKGTHPTVMEDRIKQMSWGSLLRYEGTPPDMKKKFGTKYRIMNFIEHKLLGGRTIGGFKNYKIVGKY